MSAASNADCCSRGPFVLLAGFGPGLWRVLFVSVNQVLVRLWACRHCGCLTVNWCSASSQSNGGMSVHRRVQDGAGDAALILEVLDRDVGTFDNQSTALEGRSRLWMTCDVRLIAEGRRPEA